jgi:hypothetical protein
VAERAVAVVGLDRLAQLELRATLSSCTPDCDHDELAAVSAMPIVDVMLGFYEQNPSNRAALRCSIEFAQFWVFTQPTLRTRQLVKKQGTGGGPIVRPPLLNLVNLATCVA